MNGPLAGLRVVELVDELGAYAGKLLGDLGADVVKLEPPGGHPSRRYPPFVADEPHPDRSLTFWQYNTSKRSVIVDLDRDAGRAVFADLVARADIVLESQPPDRLAALSIDYADLAGEGSSLIWVSVTPFGRAMPRSEEAATDLTLLAGGGPVWSTGYDDHALPPVRGGGNQAEHIASHYAVMSALTALAYRDAGGPGQFIEVNAHAAANVTTEAATYQWLVAGETVQRQTGRHAAVRPSMPSQVRCADGRWVNTGFPARRRRDFEALRDWLGELGLVGEFPAMPLIEAGTAIERIDLGRIQSDPATREIFTAGRDAMTFIAERLPAYEFFVGGQERGFQVGIIYSPEEVIADPHVVARGWPREISHPELERSVVYPGEPYHFTASPWRIGRRPPLLGEHTDEVLADIGHSPGEIERLRREGGF